MGIQVDDIVQPHIAGQLEFQGDIVLLDPGEQCLALVAFQAGAVQAVADAHMGEGLTGKQGTLHQVDGLGHIALQRVVFTGMDPDGPVRIEESHLRDDLPDHRLQLADVADLLAHKVAAHHIGIPADHLQGFHGLGQVIAGDDAVLHQGQGDPADGSQEPDIHTGFLLHQRQDPVDLGQHPDSGGILLDQCGVADLHIPDVPLLIFPSDPEKGVFIEGQILVAGILGIGKHPGQVVSHILVFQNAVVGQGDFSLRGDALGEHIPVQVQLFQVGKHRLGVLQNGKAGADALNVFRGIFGIAQDQIGKIQEGVVIDLPVPVFAPEARQIQGLLRLDPQRGEGCLLGGGEGQLQLLDIVQGIADLMLDRQGNEDIGA